MLLGATSVSAADGDVFTANVTVIEDGATKQVPMRFQVIREDDKTCRTYATYDNLSDTYNPAIYYGQNGKVIIPEKVNGYTVVSIGTHSFNNCLFSYIQLPETIKTIHECAFYKSHLEEIDVPLGNETILTSAFRECKYLTKARISCQYVPAMCFYGCDILESVEFKTPVEYVLEAAFQYCSYLETLSFPEGLEYLNSGALRYCGPQKLILPSTLFMIWYDAFEGIHNLREVILARETPPNITYYSNSFLPDNITPVLYVPDETKYTSEPWASNFSEIRSFLPTVEQTVNTWFNYSVGLTWDLFDYNHGYTESVTASDILDLMIDGVPTVPEVWEGYNELIVSKDPKHIPQEVSFLRKTSKGLVPYKLHYNVHNFGFSINGKEMTSLDMYNIPGLVSGDAYIAVPINAPDYPTLVLDNATLEWDTNAYGLSNHDLYQDGLTIKVIGDCTIKVPNTIALGLDVATVTTIEGGGTLNIISGSYPIETAIVTWLTIQDNTTVIARNITGNSALWDQDGAKIEIRDGGVFAAYSKYEPIWLDSNGEFIFGEGIALRYPVGAYVGSGNNIYNADGTKVMNDWVVIGPDNQATQDLITGVASPKSSPEGKDFIYNLAGQRLSKPQKGIYITNGRKVLVK